MAKREMTTHELAEFLEAFASLLQSRPDMSVATLLDIINFSTPRVKNETNKKNSNVVRQENPINDYQPRKRINEVPIFVSDEPLEGFGGVPKSEIISIIENYNIPLKWSKNDSTRVLARRLQNYLGENPEVANRLESSTLSHALRLLRNIK